MVCGMVDDELQRLVDALAERLGRSVAINDPTIHLLRASRHFGDEDDVRVRAVLQRDAGSAVVSHFLGQGVTRWTRPGRVPPRDDLHMLARFCVPIRWHGTLLGLLIVIDPDDSFDGEVVDVITAAAAGMAAVMYRDHLAEDRRRLAREEVLRQLTSSSIGTRQHALACLERDPWLHDAECVTVSLVETVRPEPGAEQAHVEVALRATLQTFARGHPATVAFAVSDGRGLLVQATGRRPSDEEQRAQAEKLADQARQALGAGVRCVLGVGGDAPGLAQAWRSREQAETALRAADALPALGGVACWSRLGAYATLLQIPAERLTATLVPGPLRALVDQDPHGRLVQTLAAYLDHAGSSPETAAVLHIHRTSLYYRLRRIEEITGLDLANGEDRLTLHLGLRTLSLLPD